MLLILIAAYSCSRSLEPTSPEPVNLSLKSDADSIRIFLGYQQSIIINNETLITFEKVPADSRCPMDVICVWAGDGEVILKIQKDGIEKLHSLHTYLTPRAIQVDRYYIELKSLQPYPKSNEQIRKENYQIELVIKTGYEGDTKNVKLIDEEGNVQIKKDMININGVNLINDQLRFELNYSGGCKTHVMDLFAYKSIMKSNPPQVTVILSHDANKDACEANIRKEMKFNLLPLKEFLQKNYNITDKVILLIFDPSGRPIRNPAIEYKF